MLLFLPILRSNIFPLWGLKTNFNHRIRHVTCLGTWLLTYSIENGTKFGEISLLGNFKSFEWHFGEYFLILNLLLCVYSAGRWSSRGYSLCIDFFANLFKKVYKSNHLGTINITIFPILNVLIAVFKISWELKNRSLVPEIYLDEVIFPQVDGQVHRLWLQFWELWKILGTFQVRHERKK